jgi:hypothetical protein
VALGKLGTTSAFAFRPRETKRNLCRGGETCVEVAVCVAVGRVAQSV